MRTETKTVRFARAALAGQRDTFALGVTGDEQLYGVVQIVEKTTVTRMRSDGYPDRKHEPQGTETVLMELGREEAAHLLRTLGDAVVDSLTVRSGVFS